MTKRIYDTAVVAKRLKELRHEKGLTQRELAAKLYWSESTIKQYECGGKSGRIPAEHNLAILADFFRVNPGYILGTQDYKHKLEKWFAEIPPDTLEESRNEMAYYDRIIDVMKKNYHLDLNEYAEWEVSAFFRAFDDIVGNMAKEFKEWVGE